MKTENTPKSKAMFFSLYYGQEVMGSIYPGSKLVDPAWAIRATTLDKWPQVETSFLFLRSISSLTRDELILVSILSDSSNADELEDDQNVCNGKYQIEEFIKGESMPIAVIDYLRSISILIPWLDLSIEDIKAYGWAKEVEA